LVKDIKEGIIYIYLKNIWEKEKFISEFIYERKEFNHACKKPCTIKEIDEAEKDVSAFTGRDIKLDDTQKLAIKSAFEHKVTIVTGPAGSGKSLICRCIYSIARKLGMTVNMMTPTGKAAQVLSEKTGCPAKTIHRGLGMKPGDDAPKCNISEDILLIDETSMCGIDTMYAIAKATESNKWANIVLVGDKKQLPSVSPGNFFSDIIDSGCANVVTLDKIHRQDEGSYIALLANEIAKGKVVTIPETANDIKWYDINGDTFHTEFVKYIDDFLIGKDISDLQIISPMKKGNCGVFKLNEIMQIKMADLNRTANNPLVINTFSKFFVGDRVIQMTNNYDKDAFNGDIGIITDLGEKVIDPTVSDKKERFIIVEFEDGKKEYIGNEIEQLNLAWVLTVHKYQGSQSKFIIFIMANEAQIMMSRELVYTGLTRAAKNLTIFGNENMLRIAPTRSVILKRYTNIKRVIEELKAGSKLLDIMEKKE